MRILYVLVAVATAALVSVVLAGTAAGDHGDNLFTTLSGAEEVPKAGDPNGSGEAALELDRQLRTVCYEITVRKIPKARFAHVHKATFGRNGPVVITLGPARGEAGDGRWEGCVPDIDQALIDDLWQNHAGYYVNIHTTKFQGPRGALRGQLD